MKKVLFIAFFDVIFVLVSLSAGLCLSSQDIITLKKAGINDETIKIMMEEKTVETCAFTVNEIIDLKKAGISNETIQMFVKSDSFLKDTEPVIYGREVKSIKFTTAGDIIKLREAGLSDDVIRAVIIYGSGNSDDLEREKAWEMLKNMGIVVDKR